MHVRNFAPEDAEPLSQLIIRNLRQVLIKDYPNEAIEALIPSYTSKKIIDRSTHQVTLVGTLGNDLVGTAALDYDRVRDVFVDIARHRSGIGKKLMAALEADAQQRQLKKLYLMSSLSAAGFYEKLGYNMVERIDRDLNGIPLPVIHMEKVF